MDLNALTVDRNLAREKFLEYRSAIRSRRQKQLDEIAALQLAEDEQIMRGYRAIARGRQVIDIVATIKAGGLIEKTGKISWNGRTLTSWLPRLAVIRADQEYCHVATYSTGGVLFYKDSGGPLGRETRYPIRLPSRSFNFPVDRDKSVGVVGLEGRWRAMVPHIPPALRPADKIGNYHILFEAEWEQTAPPAPRDPALLKHIGGDLYAVLAVWDLTDLEMSVLGQRRR